MKTYTDRMETMQTVRMAEGAYQAFQGMLTSFAEQLAGANKGVYDAVDTNLRQKMTKDNADEKFKRSKGEWRIRVISDYSIAKGTEHKTIRWDDYHDYLNTSVFLKPLKALNGSTIDFNSPATYEDLDLTMMQTYAKLEESAIMDEINAVFGEGGSFSKHSDREFARLGDEFSDAYKDYLEGEQKKKGGVLNAPIVPGVPVNLKTVGVMAIGVAGGPWAAFAAQTLLTMGEVAEGDMSLKQGAFQVGMNLATTGLTFGAGEYFKDTAGELLKTQLTSTAGSTLLSGVELSPHGVLSYDTKRMTDDRTWLNAGKSFAINYAAASAQGGFKKAYDSTFAGAIASGTIKCS